MKKTDDMETNSADNHEMMEVTAREYGALIDIRGLQADAHSMVMTGKRNPDGSHTLKGSAKTFVKLAHDLSEEIEFELSPLNNLRQLAKVYRRLMADDFF